MAKKNKNHEVEPEVVFEEETPIVEGDNLDEEEVKEIVTATGRVTNRLNIRENDSGSSDTAIVSIVEAGEEITVYPEEGNAMFFKVKTKSGVEGYAMRRYVVLS